MTARAEMIIGLLVAIALAVGISMFAGHYTSLQRAAAQNELRGGVLESTSAGVAQGEQNQRERDETDRGLAAGRETFNESIDRAIKHEPETASRADRAVPTSVRDAYRQRRLARQRLGCAGRECESGREADPAAER